MKKLALLLLPLLTISLPLVLISCKGDAKDDSLPLEQTYHLGEIQFHRRPGRPVAYEIICIRNVQYISKVYSTDAILSPIAKPDGTFWTCDEYLSPQKSD